MGSKNNVYVQQELFGDDESLNSANKLKVKHPIFLGCENKEIINLINDFLFKDEDIDRAKIKQLLDESSHEVFIIAPNMLRELIDNYIYNLVDEERKKEIDKANEDEELKKVIKDYGSLIIQQFSNEKSKFYNCDIREIHFNVGELKSEFRKTGININTEKAKQLIGLLVQHKVLMEDLSFQHATRPKESEIKFRFAIDNKNITEILNGNIAVLNSRIDYLCDQIRFLEKQLQS